MRFPLSHLAGGSWFRRRRCAGCSASMPMADCEGCVNEALLRVLAARDLLDCVLWATPGVAPLDGVTGAIGLLSAAARQLELAGGA